MTTDFAWRDSFRFSICLFCTSMFLVDFRSARVASKTDPARGRLCVAGFIQIFPGSPASRKDCVAGA
jgi:hypothetical protein